MEEVNMNNVHKVIMPTGKMSNLVGLHYIKFRDHEFTHEGITRKSYYRGTIIGKVDDTHYLAQVFNNVIKIIHVNQMTRWLFYKSEDEASYFEERHNRGFQIDAEL